ncbi:MAG: extensin family protein [Myxococcota bacterium]|nr:extensin family protein [Myxococcota bacterium]
MRGVGERLRVSRFPARRSAEAAWKASAVVAMLAAGAAAGDDRGSGRAVPAGLPWHAPWRAVRVGTPEDAVLAWSMVRGFFGNMREGHAHEAWVTDPEAMPPARPIADCLAELRREGLDYVRTDRACRMSAQVRVDGPVEGVRFVVWNSEGRTEFVLGCELALRLPRIARVLRGLGVVELAVGSPARFSLRSYHRFGLALDVYRVGLADGTRLLVENDYVRRPDRGTCEGDPPEPGAGRLLREIACRLFDERVLSTVITPDYNTGHRDHFHWDIRPGDDRFYLR